MNICDLCIAATASSVNFKKSSITGTRLYINDLCATAIGNLSKLHEINLPKLLRNSIFLFRLENIVL